MLSPPPPSLVVVVVLFNLLNSVFVTRRRFQLDFRIWLSHGRSRKPHASVHPKQIDALCASCWYQVFGTVYRRTLSRIAHLSMLLAAHYTTLISATATLYDGYRRPKNFRLWLFVGPASEALPITNAGRTPVSYIVVSMKVQVTYTASVHRSACNTTLTDHGR